MKKITIFGLGSLTGVIVTFLFFFLLGSLSGSQSNNDIQYFQQPGDCITKNDLEVFQVLEVGALAHELKPTDLGTSNGLVVLIYSDDISFYDEQKIKIPKNKCARQIGVYTYKTRNNNIKTVPVVEIRE